MTRSKPQDLVRDVALCDRQLPQIARVSSKQNFKTREIEHLFDIIGQPKADGRWIVFISHKLKEIFEDRGRREGASVGRERRPGHSPCGSCTWATTGFATTPLQQLSRGIFYRDFGEPRNRAH